MKPKKQETPACDDMFRLRLQHILDQHRALYRLAERSCASRMAYAMPSRYSSRPIPSANRTLSTRQHRHSPTQCQCGYAPAGARCPVRLEKNLPPGYAYKKASVMLMGINGARTVQGSLLLEHGSDERSQRLMQAIDMLNARYGRNTVSVFTPSSPKPWAMRREAMSPCYTTRWSDLPVAHAR